MTTLRSLLVSAPLALVLAGAGTVPSGDPVAPAEPPGTGDPGRAAFVPFPPPAAGAPAAPAPAPAPPAAPAPLTAPPPFAPSPPRPAAHAPAAPWAPAPAAVPAPTPLPPPPPQDTADIDGDEMAAMMAAAARYTQPGEKHELLERMLGTWNMQTRITMGPGGPPEPGTATFRWLIEGRWLAQEGSGRMMGMPIETFSILGYDNFKMSYVWTTVSSMDTAMNRAEGDLTPDGRSLILYGTLDEYLTGEHDKMVKYAWRFVSDEEMVLEIHDLPIGEEDTKVVEVVYTRQ